MDVRIKKYGGRILTVIRATLESQTEVAMSFAAK
jgi:hypothetical protein